VLSALPADPAMLPELNHAVVVTVSRPEQAKRPGAAVRGVAVAKCDGGPRRDRLSALSRDRGPWQQWRQSVPHERAGARADGAALARALTRLAELAGLSQRERRSSKIGGAGSCFVSRDRC